MHIRKRLRRLELHHHPRNATRGAFPTVRQLSPLTVPTTTNNTKMQVSIVLLLTAGLFLLCASMCCCEPIKGSYERADVMARPTRPKVFSSPDDLKNYLEELGNFYAIAGRPRFGKRTLAPWMANSLRDDAEPYRSLPITNAELLQILSSFQKNQDK